MKKLVILLIIGLVFGLINTNVSAAEKKSYKTEIESLLKKMADFEFSLLYEIDITEPKVGTTKSIKLDKDRMSRAAAFTLNYSSDDMVFKYGDGLDDGLEVKNGFDPLKTDTDDDGVPDGKKEFEQTYVFDTASLGWRYEELLKSAGQKMTIMGSEMIIPEGIGFLKRVLIKASVAGDIYDIFEVKNMFGEHVMLTGVPYIGGIPVEISIDKDYLKNGFKSAKVIFEFDDSCFPEDKEIEIGPARCDDDLYFPQLIEDCELDEDNKTISFNIDKPGYYFIILIE